MKADDPRRAFLEHLRRPGCAMCGRDLAGSSLNVSVDPPVLFPPEWKLCSVDCLHLFAERAANAGIDVEWLLGNWPP